MVIKKTIDGLACAGAVFEICLRASVIARTRTPIRPPPFSSPRPRPSAPEKSDAPSIPRVSPPPPVPKAEPQPPPKAEPPPSITDPIPVPEEPPASPIPALEEEPAPAAFGQPVSPEVVKPEAEVELPLRNEPVSTPEIEVGNLRFVMGGS